MMSSGGSRSSWEDSSQPFDEDEIDFFADLDGQEKMTETPSLFDGAESSTSSSPPSSPPRTKSGTATRTTAVVATTTSTTTTTSEMGEEQQGVEVFPRQEKTKSASSSLPTIVESTRNATTTTATTVEPKRRRAQQQQQHHQPQSQPDEDETEKNLRQAELALRHKIGTGGGGEGDCCGGTGLLVWTRFFINNYSAVLVFGKHLISLESLLSIALSISMTIYAYNATKDNDSFDGSSMSWVLLTFAVVTPMSASIGMAFKRREDALGYLAVLKSTLMNLYGAHCSWDWPTPDKLETTGRNGCNNSIDWLDHADQSLRSMWYMVQEMTRFLTLPNATRARHRVTAAGRRQAEDIAYVSVPLFRSAMMRVAELTILCEVLKRNGLPPNEAIRIRQWERSILEQLEKLRTVKQYRTPQALRSFARLFSVFLPPFYAPYYGQMAHDLNSLAMAIAFAIVTSVALTSLFESIYQMEDPFIGIIALDGIDVEQELQVQFHQDLLDRRQIFFPTESETRPFVLVPGGGDGNDNSDDDDNIPMAPRAEVRLWQVDGD